MQLTLAQKGIVIISIPLVFIIVLILSVAQGQKGISVAQTSAEHSEQVVVQALSVSQSLLEAESAVRAYAITTDSRLRAPYDRARNTLPALGNDTPDRYAAALYIGDAIAARGAQAARADSLEVKSRAVGGAHKTLEVTLIEKDGAAWSATVPTGAAWSTVSIPLSTLQSSRSINIPSPYPGLWNYWRASPASRGRKGDHVHIENVERLQLTVYPNIEERSADDGTGAAVESIRLHFTG